MIKKYIEDKCVKELYNCGFQRHASVSINKKEIIFKPLMGLAMFRIYGSFKEHIVAWVLIRWYNYKVYEERLTWCNMGNKDINKDKPKIEVRIEEPILN